jgi:hypothetical protein
MPSRTVSVTRTADTNAYTANDVIGAATGATAAIEFENLFTGGKLHRITGASMLISATALISGEANYRLHLYNVTPPSALGDNAAFDIPSGDRSAYLGFIDLGTPVDLGSSLFIKSEQAFDVRPLTTSLWAYPVTIGAYTPASSGVYRFTLHAVELD